MRKVIIAILLLGLFMGVVASESYTFQKEDIVNFPFVCLDENNAHCTSSTVCTITTTDPTGSKVLDNYSMSFNETFFNVSLNTNEEGIYSNIIVCTSSNATSSEFTYLVTVTGNQFDTPKSILYTALLSLFVFLFILAIYTLPRLPSGNNTDEDTGQLLSVNHLKYLRPILYIIVWMLVVCILFISANLSLAYLQVDLLGSLLFKLFYIMLAVTPIWFILWVLLLIIQAIKDKELQKVLDRGFEF